MKAITVFNKTQRLRDSQDKIPWSVKRLFRNGIFEIDIVGNEISFGEDYVSLEEARDSFEFIVKQLGGKIEWS